MTVMIADDSARQLDGRTKLARRAKQLARAFKAELGGTLSDAQLVAVKRAAEMATIAERTRARWMAGDWNASSTDVVRIDSAARRAIRDLNLPTSDVRPTESLEEYLERTAVDTDDGEIDELADNEQTP